MSSVYIKKKKDIVIDLYSDYLVPAVKDGGHRGSDAQQDLQHLGQVDMDEVAQFLDHHVDDVQQAVLTAQRQHGTHICLGYGPQHC